jgi:cbb3-type cytochrome oxidase cytochrome c subunit
MTLDHVGVPNAIIDQSILKTMPIYNWLKRQPTEKQSLHNIRLKFGLMKQLSQPQTEEQKKRISEMAENGRKIKVHV